MLEIKNQSEKAILYLSGEIIDDEEGSWLSTFRDGDTTGYEFPKKLRDQLETIDKKAELEIHINSCGGSVFAGVAMSNFIANHKGRTIAICDGVAASVASQIFLSADVSKIPANGYLMLHRPFTIECGNAEELRKAADVLDTIQKGLIATYKKKAKEGITDEQLNEMMKAETWLVGDEATEIFQIELLEPVKTLNCVDLDKLKDFNYQKIPEALKLKLKDDGNKNPPSILFEEQQRQQKLYEDRKKQIEIALAKSLAIAI